MGGSGGSYTYTSADVQRMVERKRRERGGFNVATERARLVRERDFAQQSGDRDVFAEWVPPPAPLPVLLIHMPEDNPR